MRAGPGQTPSRSSPALITAPSTIIAHRISGALLRPMPEKSRRIFATQTGRLSKIVDAPIRYVYDWCTDFRSDDAKLEGSKSSHRVIRVSPQRLVRVKVASKGAKNPAMNVEVVRLSPPNAWHKDTIGEEDLDSMDYKLTALSPNKTRVTLVMVERWMVPKYPKKADWLRSANKYWDELVLAIEERYRSGRPAKG